MIPPMGDTFLRTILAANLRRMIDAATPAGAKPSIHGWAVSKGLNVRLIDRLVNGKHAVKLDTIDEVAKTLGVPAWTLLVENYDGEPAPALMTDEDRELLARLRRLLG